MKRKGVRDGIGGASSEFIRYRRTNALMYVGGVYGVLGKHIKNVF